MIRLHHVNVVVPPGRTVDVLGFYELLGLRQVDKPREGVAQTGAWFDFPDGRTQVHVSERDGTPLAAQHFAVLVEDFDKVVAALQASGRPWTPGSVLAGARRGMTADPCGNAVELLEVLADR